MNELLKFFDKKVMDYPMHMQIYYSKNVDWCIKVWKKGCGENGQDINIVNVECCDMELCFAQAHVQLKQWLMENEGGY